MIQYHDTSAVCIVSSASNVFQLSAQQRSNMRAAALLARPAFGSGARLGRYLATAVGGLGSAEWGVTSLNGSLGASTRVTLGLFHSHHSPG